MVNFKLSTETGDKIKSCSNFDNSLKYHSHDERIQLQAELYHQAKILNVECHLGQSIVFVGKPDAILKVMGKHYLVECGIKNIGEASCELNNETFALYLFLSGNKTKTISPIQLSRPSNPSSFE